MKILAYKHGESSIGVTPSPNTELLEHTDIIFNTLLTDLVAVPGIEVIAACGWHPPFSFDRNGGVVRSRPVMQCFSDHVMAADAVWLVAPARAHVMEHLSREVLRCRRILLGSSPDAVRIAASKRLAANALVSAGIPVIQTYLPQDQLPGNVEAWVVKPDDGTACFDIRIFHGLHAALDWIGCHNDRNYVLQPFISGKSYSLSLLCCDGGARILSCDEQRVAVRNNQFHYLGSTMHGMAPRIEGCQVLAQRIAQSIPGLWGYVSVDFIMTQCGAVVLEINPYLTSSYGGLHASLNRNPAAMVLQLLQKASVDC